MSVFKKGLTWYIDYYVEGRRRREAVGPNRKMAEKALAKRKVQIAEGRFLNIRKQSKVTFEELSEAYMKYARTNKRSWGRDGYSIKWLSGEFAGKRLRDITALSIEEYKWNVANINPAGSVKLMRVNNMRVRFLSKEECKALYLACSYHLRPIVLIALHTGIRRGEILDLGWDDVDFEHRLIRVKHTKNGEPRDIPMSEEVYFALSRLEVQAPRVFCRPGGGVIRDLRTAFANALRRANITNFAFYDLRHTFASHLVMSGVDLLTIKELLGHKSIDMTLRYSHLSPSHKRKAMESLKLLDRHFLDTCPKLSAQLQGLSACATSNAEVVKLVDTLRSGRSSRKRVGVRVPPSAFFVSPVSTENPDTYL